MNPPQPEEKPPHRIEAEAWEELDAFLSERDTRNWILHPETGKAVRKYLVNVAVALDEGGSPALREMAIDRVYGAIPGAEKETIRGALDRSLGHLQEQDDEFER